MNHIDKSVALCARILLLSGVMDAKDCPVLVYLHTFSLVFLDALVYIEFSLSLAQLGCLYYPFSFH